MLTIFKIKWLTLLNMKKENIYNLLCKNKIDFKKDTEKIPFEDTIEFLIKINIIKMNDIKFRNIIDLSLYFIKNINKLKYSKNENNLYKSYYLDKLIEKKIIALPKYIKNINFNLNPKIQILLDFYIRTTKNNNNSLLILFYIIKNYQKVSYLIKKKSKNIISVLEEDIDDNISDTDNELFENNNNGNLCVYENILDLDIAKKLKEIKLDNINSGKFSEITYLDLDLLNKRKIQKKINRKIENIIVKKKYKLNNEEEDLKFLIEDYGGIEVLFNKEIKCLKCLFGLDHFPLLLAIDYDNLEIYMNYCGKNVNKNNIPRNWKKQIDKIITSLDELNIYNNDFWINNLLVHKKILYMIDFGFSSFYEQDFPFINLSKDDLADATDLIILLDNAMIKSIEKRLFSKL